MRDPMDQLESFTEPGLTMTPLSPAEVRRRGDRLRRRNTALTAVGVAAAVAVTATPLAIFAGNHQRTTPDPAPAPVVWRHEIPADFPIADGMPSARADGSDVAVDDAAVVDNLTVCGETAYSSRSTPRAVDIVGADYSGNENGSGRTLALYADADAAEQHLTSLRTAVETCPAETPDADGWGARYDLWPTALGEESLAYTRRGTDSAGLRGDMEYFQVVRVGNALLLSSGYTEGGSADAFAQETVDGVAEDSADVVAEMCVFSAEGCGPEQADDAPTPDNGAGAIPDGFELLDGLPLAGATKHFGRRGPGETQTRIDLAVCGRTVPDANTVDDLRADFTDPASLRQRHLMLFADEDAAETWLVGAGGGYADCEVDGGNGVVRSYQVLGSPLGESARTAVGRHYVDGEPGPGYEIVELVRVGPAVVVSKINADGDEAVTDDRLTALVDTSRNELSPVVDAMCTFSTNGC